MNLTRNRIAKECTVMKRTSLPVLVVFLGWTFIANLFGQTPTLVDLEKIQDLNNRVLAMYGRGQYAQALTLADEALKSAQETLGPDHPIVTDCLNNLGGMYENLGRYPEAEAMFKRGLKLREKVLGPDHEYTARNLNNLGLLYILMGRYEEAEPLLLRSLAINKKVLSSDNKAIRTDTLSLANMYLQMGEYDKALAVAEPVLPMVEQLLGPDHLEVAQTLDMLASIHVRMGNYAKAEPLFQRSLKIHEQKQGSDHPDFALSLYRLGTLYQQMGDAAKAESYLHRAISILEVNPGEAHPNFAKTLASLAILYLSMDDFGRAAPMLNRALSIEEKTLGADHPDLANTLMAMAGLQAATNNPLAAIKLGKQALVIYEKRLGPNHPLTALAMMNLGANCLAANKLSEAKDYCQRALVIQEKTLGPEHPELASCLNNLGAIYGRQGDYTNAGAMFQRALAIDNQVLGATHFHTLMPLVNLAMTCFDLQDTNGALSYEDKAEFARRQILDNILSFTSEEQRLKFGAQIRPYTLFASLNDAPRLEQAILNHKGLVLDSLLEDQLIARAGRSPYDHMLIEKLAPAKRRLTEFMMTVPNDLRPAPLHLRAQQQEKIALGVDELQGELARRVMGFGNARRGLNVSADQVQKVIPTNSVLVEYIAYDHYLGKGAWERDYGATVLNPTGEPRWVNLGPVTNIDLNIAQYQRAIRRAEAFNNTNELSLALTLHLLDRLVWEPVQRLFSPDTKFVIVSPDALLNFVSFATILTPRNQFLAERYSIRYVASGRDLLHEPVKHPNPGMVIFASPDYASGSQTNSPEAGVNLAPLPFFLTNALAIKTQAESWNWPVQIYSGAQATESTLREIHPPSILQFATHGVWLPETIKGPSHFYFWNLLFDNGAKGSKILLLNPMTRSVLALAGAQPTLNAWARGEIPATENDGILTAEEVGGLDLHETWLVVLSACDTGIGSTQSGEGVMGLRRGFAQAGVQHLVMTLWPVFDKSSGELMVDFYSALHENNNPPLALAEVQRNYLTKLRTKWGLVPAVVLAGAFIVNSQGDE